MKSSLRYQSKVKKSILGQKMKSELTSCAISLKIKVGVCVTSQRQILSICDIKFCI